MKKRRKIFQRAAALLCCIFLLPSLVAVPALAAEDMNIFFDVMDAGFMGSLYGVTPDSNEIVVDFGQLRVVKYVDFVFTRSGAAPSRIFFKSNYDGSEHRLNVLSLGNMMYRAYGEVSVHSATSFSFVFETTGTTYIYPYSCDVSFNISRGFADIGSMIVSDNYNLQVQKTMDAPTSPLYFDFWYPDTLDNPYTYQYVSTLFFENWRKYDYLDVYLIVSDANISSITCYLDEYMTYVPFEVSVIGDTELFDWEVNETGGTIRYFPSGLDSCMHVNLRIDLTELFRYGSSNLCIGVNGQYSTDVSYLCLYSVTGYLSSDESELDTFWLKLKNFFTDLFNPEGGDDAADDFASDVEEQSEELNNMVNVMGSVEKPAVEDVNMSVNSFVDPAVLATSTEGLSTILGNEIILKLLILSLTMATVAYVLFGKR